MIWSDFQNILNEKKQEAHDIICAENTHTHNLLFHSLHFVFNMCMIYVLKEGRKDKIKEEEVRVGGREEILIGRR